VVQKHAARRLHYDLRLQMGNVLQSWAVPHGPSLNPTDKRLAVQVETHPIDYADFEGIIPEGNYGAGAVIVWDRGVWRPLVDPEEGFAAGDLKFELYGYKLRGEFALVRTPRAGSGEKSHWLLIKKRDGYAAPAEPPGEESILSGLTIEQIRGAADLRRQLEEELRAAGAVEGHVDLAKVRLALCTVCEEPFSDPGWVYELKYDGYRVVVGLASGEPIVRYRGGHDATDSFPEIAAALRALPVEDVAIDGELVCLDESGKSDFSRLQRRALLTRASDVERARVELPATVVGFDLLSLSRLDARPLGLVARKSVLAKLLPTTGVVRYCEHIAEIGEDFYAKVQELDLEGMVAKRADSRYRAGRLPTWLKVRVMRVSDFAVLGYRESDKLSRAGFAALHLGVRDGDRWIYAGRVGSGFGETELSEIRAALDRGEPADHGVDDSTDRDVWVEPELVCVVRYMDWPLGRLLREPIFLHLDHGKIPDECRRPVIHGDAPDEPPEVESDGREIALSNLDKVFWPATDSTAGYTKGDLIDYYKRIAPYLLPYLADRPLVLTRYPDGIEGKSFYQKDAPSWAPDWIPTKTVWSEHSQREIHYFIAADEAALIYLANLGTIPLHVWCSRASDLAHPDWCILDLDPKGAPFSHVIKIARAIHDLCESIELPAYCKTSGSTGLHVLIPLGRLCTYEQSRQLAGLIAQVTVNDNPEIATLNRSIDARDGKVYLDWLQNRHGQLLVAPLSARPLPGAPVSMPVRWSELERRLDFRRFTIKSAPRRMAALAADPCAGVLTDKPDLLAALERLAERLDDGVE
jgi:bifunctional non-homologous end joining protein LigD